MLRVLGGPKQLCNGITRRELLMAGGLGMLGVSDVQLTSLLAAAEKESSRAAGGHPGFGSAKNVILLYLFGGPSHLEVCDMKPDAPVEVRGELRPIPSSLPGCDVCEHLPHMAKVMAHFEMRCKTAGEKIKRTVENVEGLLLMTFFMYCGFTTPEYFYNKL